MSAPRAPFASTAPDMADQTCPHGHASTWDDFCSVCGDAMDGDATPAAPAVSPAASGGTCPNCGNPFGAEDVFCESCGYDFATGTLPEADPAPLVAPPAAPAAPAPQKKVTPEADTSAESTDEPSEPTDDQQGASAAKPTPVPTSAQTPADLVAVVSCDRGYFDNIVGSAGLEYPDPEPQPTTIALTGAKILIGRLNQARGVYPEIDIDASTGDPAASTRHAMLRQVSDGAWTITDLDSTNGTMLDDTTSALSPGTEVPVTAGSVIFVGAFTKITLKAG